MGIFGGGDIPSTQQHLDIEDIRDDLAILLDGTVSLVIETTSVNFDLLSEGEQDAKIYSFAGLLNSLNFHFQILVRTQRTDLTKYVDSLESMLQRQITPGLRRQMEIYIQFIRNLTVTNQVLDKRFFIILPSKTTAAVRTSALKQLFGKEEKIINADEVLEAAKKNLYPKRDHILKQLNRMGLFGRQLTTNELIKLFYGIYDSSRQGLEKLQINKGEYTSMVVEPKFNQQ